MKQVFSDLWIRTLKFRDIKSLAQGHTANKGQSRHVNSGLWILGPGFFLLPSSHLTDSPHRNPHLWPKRTFPRRMELCPGTALAQQGKVLASGVWVLPSPWALVAQVPATASLEINKALSTSCPGMTAP